MKRKCMKRMEYSSDEDLKWVKFKGIEKGF